MKRGRIAGRVGCVVFFRRRSEQLRKDGFQGGGPGLESKSSCHDREGTKGTKQKHKKHKKHNNMVSTPIF
jgi:hypothetical protein